MDWVGLSLFGYREAARKFKKPADLQSILKTINITSEQFEEIRKEVAQKDTAGLKVTAQTSGAIELYDPIITYLTWIVLHDKFKSKKEKPEYPTHQEYDFFHDLLVAGKFDDIRKIISNDNVPRNQLQQYIQKFQSSNKSDNKLTKEDLKVLNNKKEVVDLGGGWSWITLVDDQGNIKGGSTVLTKILGHCGNGEGLPGDKMYLLSNKTMGLIPTIKATVIVDGEGKIRESKASFNRKININKYGGAFLKLLEQPFVKGLDDSGAYMADSNLHMSDFSGTPFEEQAKALIEKKPNLMNNDFDQVITKYKDEVSSLSPEDKKDELRKLLEDGHINLVQARALNGGKFPFTDDELVGMIDGGLDIGKIISAGNSLFSLKVQQALAKKDPSKNISYMLYMAATLNNSPIDKKILIEGLNSAKKFKMNSFAGDVGDETKNKLTSYLKKNTDLLSAYLKKDPSAIDYFPEDQRMHIFNKMPEAFAEVFKKVPSAIRYFPEDKRMDIFNQMPEAFAEGFYEDPSSIGYFPEDKRMDIFNRMPEVFAEGFKEVPWSISYFPEDKKMDIFNRMPEAFAEGFKKIPSAIGYFPEDQHGYIKETIRKINEKNRTKEAATMNKISTLLDTIANRLEAKGLIKEAFSLDTIANTLEKCAAIDPYAATLIAHAKGNMNQIQQAAQDVKQLGKKGIESVGPVEEVLEKHNLTLKSKDEAALENLCANLLKI